MSRRTGDDFVSSGDGVVFVADEVGLANRLRALAGYGAMSRCLFARPVRLHWAPSRFCPAQFEELFSAADVELVGEEELAATPPDDVHAVNEWFQQIWVRSLQDVIPQQTFFAAVRQFLDGLIPHEQVAATVREFERESGLANTTGLHIRQTDNVASYKRQNEADPAFDMARVTRVEGFRLLVEQNPEQEFFLATDSYAVQRDMSGAFGNRVRTMPKRFSRFGRLMEKALPAAGFRTSTMRDALAELILLGRCREIVGTYYSSYGEFAAVWGGCNFSTMKGVELTPEVHLNNTIAQLRDASRGSRLGQEEAGLRRPLPDVTPG